MKYYCEDSQQVLQELNSQKSGLTEKEAAERLLQNGANELKAAKGKSLLRRFAEQVADPMIVILLAAAAISGVLAVLENDSFADVIIILAVVLINAVLGVYQESKAEKAIEALQDMAAATSKVVRDGKMSSILSKDLVVGDIICLEAGDAVPADARILESASLKAEEAALTGESVPVTKLIDQIFLADGERDVPLGDRKNMVYMGSTIVYGRAVAVVTATGMDTEMGKIADALSQAQEGQTPLQRKLLAQIIDHIDDLNRRIGELDKLVQEYMAEYEAAIEAIDEIPGIARRSAEVILAEIGLDMGRFPSAAHLCSWAGVCPGNYQSAGRRKHGKTTKGNKALKTILTQCAKSAKTVKSSYFFAQYQRISARRGKNRATLAVAHSMLIAIYHILKNKTAFHDLGSDYYDSFNRDRKINSYLKRLKALGWEPDAIPSSA